LSRVLKAEGQVFYLLSIQNFQKETILKKEKNHWQLLLVNN